MLPLRRVSKRRARKRAPQESRKPELTAEALERPIADRFGVFPVQVSVRGTPPDWSASLIANRLGNAQRHAAFSSRVHDLRGDYDLKAG